MEQVATPSEELIKQPPASEPPSNETAAIPGTLQVIKRDKRLANFDQKCIEMAIKRAFLAVEGNNSTKSTRVNEIAFKLASSISTTLRNRWPGGGLIHIESIQDKVELALMLEGLRDVAVSYVLYREERKKQREAQLESEEEGSLQMICRDGTQATLKPTWLQGIIKLACNGHKDVDPETIYKATYSNLVDNIPINEVYNSMTLAARPLIELEPNYSFVTAELLRRQLFEESLFALNVSFDPLSESMDHYYPTAFKAFIQKGIEIDIINPNLTDFDLDRLASALQPERDRQFTYLSLQTLYDRYFIHHKDQRLELPQVFFMRVAMGLAHCEGAQRNERAIEFYQLLSSFDYMSSTPTLFNSGTTHSQLSSCFLTTVPDSLEGIYGALRDNALLSKFAGGLGNDWTPVRALGAHIKGTNGKSLGVVPFLNVADATAVAVNQGGKRKGAVCAYLETWHMDIEEFLELRKNTGDERRRTHDMNTANWVPDLFMERVFEDGEWTLFSPDQVGDLHDAYGTEFKALYTAYEAKAKAGIVQSKTIRAVDLWRKMLGMLFETGHPWLTFKDPCNLRSPQQHIGVVHSSNLCTEITLNTSAGDSIETDEVAVCNLGSINLAHHIVDGKLDSKKLEKTVKTAVRMLDNVIDINYYSIPQARNSNLKHRPVGLGIMGFQDSLHMQKLAYSSNEAVEFADECMEIISYHAITASVDLAKERGTYESFDGSLWSQGILPIDSIQRLADSRGKYLEQDLTTRLDWKQLRKRVKKEGIRNSNLMAIAPTATISNICGVSQSIEPTFQNLFVKSNMSGEFTVVNPHLVAELKEINLWDTVMVHDLKYFNGSVQSIDRIPQEIKSRYSTAFEIEPRWLVDAASRRQKWIDQAQSLNLYMAEPSGKKLDVLYKMAWLRGLKTTYYLRSVGATQTEKATIHDAALNAVQSQGPQICSIDDPDCEACQ
jgi:ribonucleoside-diphosphate reductase alpha chain